MARGKFVLKDSKTRGNPGWNETKGYGSEWVWANSFRCDGGKKEGMQLLYDLIATIPVMLTNSWNAAERDAIPFSTQRAELMKEEPSTT